MSDTIRVRFAPSPTGFLHVGGARTALFNWLFARNRGGTFVLRIEDTDRARSSDEMTAVILAGMRWLGLDWDEGPFHQADGIERHREDARALLDAGWAYRCFCTPEALAARREAAEGAGEAFRYDRLCLREVGADPSAERAAAGEPHVIRFRVPEGTTAWQDAVHGRIEFANRDIEDFIVLRSDGSPTYNLAVVSDDAAAAISHVIRGDDHISNTPKQILLYRGLGLPLPVFAHVPMILGPDGRRLSKRHGATAVGEYENAGILPWAMVNFLALLGWSPGTDEEIFEVPELIRRFSLEGINTRSAVFDVQKLEWLNGQHISRADATVLQPLLTPRLLAAGLADAEKLEVERDWYLALIDLLKVRARTLDDMVERARPFLADRVEVEEEAAAKHWKRPGEVASRLRDLRRRLADLGEWREVHLEEALRALADEHGIGAGKLIHPLRVALTGTAVSPGIFEVLVVMGRERALARVDAALEDLARRAEDGAPSTRAEPG